MEKSIIRKENLIHWRDQFWNVMHDKNGMKKFTDSTLIETTNPSPKGNLQTPKRSEDLSHPNMDRESYIQSLTAMGWREVRLMRCESRMQGFLHHTLSSRNDQS
ncbi:18132_t:CDS:2 [Acaulospora morrowiae]|uniref:18132_t:CDS:1 n=1 Tax=Acaulospora morrowiae TaxID=94023 RepID=A0A9N9F2H3_9GLOM|nr:18132_t:CDS:2 [Acaulospora morrowiae]